MYAVPLSLVPIIATASPVELPKEGDQVDVAPWAQLMRWEPDGTDVGLMWEDARDIFRVVVTFPNDGPVPDPSSLQLQYWRSSWPQRRIPRDKPSGAGSSGWLDIGDWYRGEWQTIDCSAGTESAGTVSFSFAPVNAKEFKDLGDFDARYRSTLKLRVAGKEKLPDQVSIQAFTDSTWSPLAFEVEWGGKRPTTARQPRLELFNAHQVRFDQGENTIAAEVLYAAPKAYNSFDRSVITIRQLPGESSSDSTFSFAADDLVDAGHIFIPGYEVIVRRKGDTTTYEQARAAWQASKTRDLYTRVFDAPEQTLTQAWNDTPAKGQHLIPLSFEGGRQPFGLEETGNLFCTKNEWMKRSPGKDFHKARWPGGAIRYQFGLPTVRPQRERIDGCLPMMRQTWEAGGVRYVQTCYVVPLNGVPEPGGRIWGDDTLVLMMRMDIERIGDAHANAALHFTVQHDEGNDPLVMFPDGWISIPNDQIPEAFRVKEAPLRRMHVVSLSPGVDDGFKTRGREVVWQAALTVAQPTRRLEIRVPWLPPTGKREAIAVSELDFDTHYKAVARYWQERIEASAAITTPEPMINEFYNAHATHLLINTEREAGISDRYMARVGSFYYGVYNNESAMMISDLDRRGYHERAAQALESWLYYQGTRSLPGDFSTKEGQFYGCGGYEASGYNQHHGWALWNLGEHYWYTRDKAWLAHAAPHIVKGCDWVRDERARMTEEAGRTPIRAIEKGLLPQGELEDIGDWRSWLVTNVYTWWGMDNAVRALAEIGHPDAARLRGETDAYRADILAAADAAMRRSPVVRLRDGSWIPHIPSDAHRRGRSFGWITETLEGAIHFVRSGIIDPDSPLATWIIQDFEDNLYLSKQYGYDIPPEDLERYWFSLGGISMQANLLHNPIPYLQRDQVKHFLRAYFNAFAVSYFPDTRMMTEHALPNIGDWRGDHYKTSDEANSTYYLRMMFIQERGEDLWLGAAIPRYWLRGDDVAIRGAATYFGPMSMQLDGRRAVDTGGDDGPRRIVMEVDLPRRNPPRRIFARFRHPTGARMTGCTVDDQPYDRFDPEREWVELDGSICERRKIIIVALYD